MTMFQEKLPKKIPLRFVLIVPFMVIIILTVSLIGYIAFINGQKAINDAAHQIRSEISARIQDHLRVFLEVPRQIIEFNTTSLQQGWSDPKNEKLLQAYFLEQVKNHDTITSIYFGNADGGIIGSGQEGTDKIFYVYATEELKAGTFNKYTISGSNDIGGLQTSIPNFDARTRPWYAGAQQKGISAWNDIYILFTGQDMAISASSPVYDKQHNLLGVVSVDIALSQIEKFLHTLKISKSGQSFIMERSGLLVATSTGEKPFLEKSGKTERINARNSPSPAIKYSADFLYETFDGNFDIEQEKQFEFTIDGNRYFLTISPIRDQYGIDWLAVVVIPESDFTISMAATNRSTVLVMLIALAISIAVSVFVSQKIADRVSYLNKSARAFTHGQDEGPEMSNSRISEIDELTLSFIEMQQRLNQTVQFLKKEANESTQAKEKIRESEEQLKAVIEGSQLGYSDWNIKTGEVRRNEHWAAMLGYTLEEITTSYQQWEHLLHPDDLIRAQQSLQDHLDGKTPIHRDEYRMLAKDGNYRWVLDQGMIVEYDAQGHPTRMTATHTDITERKRAEDEIHKLNTELEQRVRDRTAQLESTNKELEAFSYSISHDLRAPLRGIDGWSQALLEDYRDRLDEQGMQYIDRVRSETQRMGHLIDDMLQLSRLTRAEMHKEQVNLSAIAHIIIERLKVEEPNRQVKFDIQENLTAKGDPHLLESVLINLLSNAFKFTGKRTNARIEFKQTEMEGRRVFFVRDNGAGFDMVYSQKLFGAFQRMHKTSEFPGSGIGLATVQRIIHRHSGEVWAEAKVDEGAALYFTLPE